MLRALYERGTVPDLVVGTSVDAINGVFIASRPQTVQTADELAEIWRGRRLIAEHTTYERIEQMPIEFHVVAVDVLTG